MVSIKLLNQETQIYEELELDKSNISFSKKNNYFMFNDIEYGYSANFRVYKTSKNETILKCPEITNLGTNSMIYKQDGVLIIDNIYNINIKFYILSSTKDYYNCTVILYPGNEMDIISDTKIKDQLQLIDDPDIHSIYWNSSSDNPYFKYANDEDILKMDTQINSEYMFSVLPYVSNARQEDVNDGTWSFLPSFNIRTLLDKLINSIDWKYVDVSNLFTDIEHRISPYRGDNIYNTAYWHWMISKEVGNEGNNQIEYIFNMEEGVPTSPSDYPIYNTKDLLQYDDFPEVEDLYGFITYYGGWQNKTNSPMTIVIPPELDGYIMLYKNVHATEHIFYNVKNPGELMYCETMSDLDNIETVSAGEEITIASKNWFAFYPKISSYWSIYQFYPHNPLPGQPAGRKILYPQGPQIIVRPKKARYNVSYHPSQTTIYYTPDEDVDNDLHVGDVVTPVASVPDTTILDLLKLYSYLTNSQIVFQSKNISTYWEQKYELKLVKDDIIPRLNCIDDKFINFSEKKRFVNEWSKTNKVELSQDEGEEYTVNYKIQPLEYINDTDIVDTEKTVEYPYYGGDSLGETISGYYSLNGSNLAANSGSLKVRDCSDYEEDKEDYEYSINLEESTLGYSSMDPGYPLLFQESTQFYNVPDVITKNAIYNDIITTNSYVKVNVKFSLLEYINLQYNDIFLLHGKMYVWFVAQYSNNVCTLQLQEISNYPVPSWPIRIYTEGGGTTSGQGVYFEGTSGIVLKATPYQGNSFLYWMDEDHNIITESWEGHYTLNQDGSITMDPIRQDYDFHAVFTNNKYNITTIKDPVGANATLIGGGSYYAGSTCTVTFTKLERGADWIFLGWYEGNTLVSSNRRYSFVVSGNRTLTARFELNVRYYLSLSSNIGNLSVEIGEGYYDSDVYANIDTYCKTDDYNFVCWKEGNNVISSTPAATIPMNRNRTLVAYYEPSGVSNVVVNINDPHGGTVTGGGSYSTGTTYTISCTPATGYTFSGWYEGNTLVSSNLTQQFTADGNGHTYTARVSPWSLMVTVNVRPSGAGTITGEGSYLYGATCILTATPSQGYYFNGWYEGNTLITTERTYRFVVEENGTLELTADFIISSTQYTITVLNDGNGSATGGGTYTTGSTCTITATPNSGYTFLGWDTGHEMIIGNPYSFTVTENATYTARFTDEYYVNLVPVGDPGSRVGGTVTGGGYYPKDQAATITAIPDSGFNFDGWNDGNMMIILNPYTFTVTGNVTIYYSFSRNTDSIVQEDSNN